MIATDLKVKHRHFTSPRHISNAHELLTRHTESQWNLFVYSPNTHLTINSFRYSLHKRRSNAIQHLICSGVCHTIINQVSCLTSKIIEIFQRIGAWKIECTCTIDRNHSLETQIIYACGKVALFVCCLLAFISLLIMLQLIWSSFLSVANTFLHRSVMNS